MLGKRYSADLFEPIILYLKDIGLSVWHYYFVIGFSVLPNIIEYN